VAVSLALVAGAGMSACSSGKSHPASSAGSATTVASSTSPTTASSPASAAAAAKLVQQQYINVVNTVRPSVVEISTSSGLGSGVVYDAQGDIVTNNHVVGTATQFQVTFLNGQTVPGTLVGAYPPDDLAVIKVSGARNLKPASFGDSSKLQVGDTALAIGNPLGLASSVTDGIISFTGRTVGEGNGVVLPDTVQTSAAINPGNSGGALVDLNAEVVGIPTLAATDPQLGGGAAAGIGFAIPSNTVKRVATQLVTQGRVTDSGRAALGISGASAVDASGQPSGVTVTQVQPGGAADKAGIKAGDVITEINGQPTPTLSDLQNALASLKPGDTVTVKVQQADGTVRSVQATLGNLTG